MQRLNSMYESPEDWRPAFVSWISTNHAPEWSFTGQPGQRGGGGCPHVMEWRQVFARLRRQHFIIRGKDHPLTFPDGHFNQCDIDNEYTAINLFYGPPFVWKGGTEARRNSIFQRNSKKIRQCGKVVLNWIEFSFPLETIYILENTNNLLLNSLQVINTIRSHIKRRNAPKVLIGKLYWGCTP